MFSQAFCYSDKKLTNAGRKSTKYDQRNRRESQRMWGQESAEGKRNVLYCLSGGIGCPVRIAL